METINPAGWPRPRGYANGVIGSGRTLFVAGQIGWNERNEFESDNFLAQTQQALRNVVAVVEAAGGTAQQIVRLTWYVVDKREYLANAAEIGAYYKQVMQGNYPAMSLVQVAALLEDRAKVEIEATAVLD